jgi:hypothetical protein
MVHIRPFSPVIGLEIYQNDVVVIRRGRAPQIEYSGRGEIGEFSRQSRARLAFIASNTHVRFKSLLTLTYPSEFPTRGVLVKRQLAIFKKRFRRKYADPQYLWTLEFQSRGAPHMHLLSDIPVRRADQTWLSQAWYDIVGSNDKKHLEAGTRWENLKSENGGRRYLVKYCAKMRQKKVPEEFTDVGRFWGYSKGLAPSPLLKLKANDRDVLRWLSSWRYLEKANECRVLWNATDAFSDALSADETRAEIQSAMKAIGP